MTQFTGSHTSSISTTSSPAPAQPDPHSTITCEDTAWQDKPLHCRKQFTQQQWKNLALCTVSTLTLAQF